MTNSSGRARPSLKVYAVGVAAGLTVAALLMVGRVLGGVAWHGVRHATPGELAACSVSLASLGIAIVAYMRVRALVRERRNVGTEPD